MIFVLVVSLYTTRIILNALGVSDFGIYNVISGFVSMFAFLNTSLSNGIQRFYNFTLGKEGKTGLTKVYNTALIIQFGLAIIIFILLETIGLWYIHEKMVIPQDRFTIALWLYQFAVISLLLVIMQIPFSASIMSHEKMDYYALVSIVDAVGKLIFASLISPINYDKLFFYGLFSLFISIANFLMYFGYSKIHFKELKLKINYDKELIVKMLSFSGWNIMGTFAFMLKAQGVTVLLNAFFGTIINAAQGIATQIQNAIQGFSNNIVTAFRPQLVQSYASGNYDRVRSMFFSLSKISFTLLFMLSVPVIIELNYILHLWLGEIVPEYTIPFTTLVLANMLLSSLHTPLVQIIHASGKMKKFQITTSLIICLIIPVSWIFLKMKYNPTCVYWVSLIIQFLNQIACMIIVREVFPYSIKKYFLKVIIPCITITIIVPLFSLFFKNFMNESFLRLVVMCLISILMTSYISYLFMNKNEKEILNISFINKLKK